MEWQITLLVLNLIQRGDRQLLCHSWGEGFHHGCAVFQNVGDPAGRSFQSATAV